MTIINRSVRLKDREIEQELNYLLNQMVHKDDIVTKELLAENDGAIITEILGSTYFIGGGTMTYRYIKSTGNSEGDLHLTGGIAWSISKAHISQIRVVTTSTDWDLWILQNDNGYATDDANIPKLQLMEGGNGEETIEYDFDYQDEDASGEVHLYVVDNIGSTTFDFYIKGVELQ